MHAPLPGPTPAPSESSTSPLSRHGAAPRPPAIPSPNSPTAPGAASTATREGGFCNGRPSFQWGAPAPAPLPGPIPAPTRYRDICAPIIARVLQETQGLPAAEVQARLRAAYPFEQRVNHPYKVWCAEIRAQGGPRLSRGRPPGSKPKKPASPPPHSTPGLQEPAPAPTAAGCKAGLVLLSPDPSSPSSLRCRACAHLGLTRSVTDHRGVKRVRRHCDQSPHGFTDLDWPACPHFQLRDNPELPR